MEDDNAVPDFVTEGDKRWQEALLEMWEIYDWWKNRRPNRVDWCDIIPFPKFHFKVIDIHGNSEMINEWEYEGHKEKYEMFLKESFEVEDSYNEEDNEMLHRLINVRGYMWT